jgi:xanthine/CO dehydrogenase XdhC/CoxF family maturation factor
VGHSDRMADSVKLLIVGEGPVTDALTVMVSALTWSVSVTSTAPIIGPDLDAVVITSHHEDVDGPAIQSALAAGVGYVGAMGSRRTQLRRREWLLAEGVSERALAALHAPIGLDIGADQPGEIALSILAEVVAARSGRLAAVAVTSIGERDGAIHPELAPGEAACPGG